MSSRKQLIPLLSGKIIALLLTMATPMVLTRYLSKNDFGIYSQFYVFLGILLGIVPMSIQNSVYYFYPILNIQKRKLLLFQTLIILILLALLAILILNVPFIENKLFVMNGLGLYSNYFYIIFFGSMITLFIHPLYVIKKDLFTSLFYPPLEIFLKVLLIIFFVVLFKSNIKSVFNALIILTIITCSIVILYVLKEVRDWNFNWDKSLLYNQLNYSLPFGFAMLIKIIATSFDKIICTFYITPEKFAIYSIAFYGVPGINLIYSSFVEVYLVPLTEYFNNRNLVDFIKSYKNLVYKTFSFTFPLILIVWLFSKQIIIFLFTYKYIEAVPLFRIFLLSFIILPLGAGLILRCTGNTKKTLYSYLFSSIISLPLTFILINYYELYGAIISSVISSALPIIFLIHEEKKILKISLLKLLPIKQMSIIIIISILLLIPFIILNNTYSIEIIQMSLISILYLFLVSITQIKLNVFIIDLNEIKNIIKLRK
jgi:O-antigen/teichoic acid export membrane protein